MCPRRTVAQHRRPETSRKRNRRAEADSNSEDKWQKIKVEIEEPSVSRILNLFQDYYGLRGWHQRERSLAVTKIIPKAEQLLAFIASRSENKHALTALRRYQKQKETFKKRQERAA
jgi:hypothetical protein